MVAGGGSARPGHGLGGAGATAQGDPLDWTPQHRLAHLARLFGLEASPPQPRLHAGPEAATRATALIPAGTPVLAVGPSANWSGKQWRVKRFAAAAAALTAPNGPLPGALIAVFGAPAGGIIDLAGSVDLPTTYACLERCAFYLGKDSGLMHMAAAGVPTLGLFGRSSEVLYGPVGRRCRALRGPRSFEDICHAPDFDHRSQRSLMDDLEVEAVVAAATDLWMARQAARD